MEGAWELIKSRWYWFVGGLIGLWLVSKFIHSSSSASGTSDASTPAGVAVSYAGTNANDAAIQVAQTQAQSTLAAQQIAGNIAVQQAQIAQQAQAESDASNIQLAGVQGQYGLAIANSNNAAAVAQANDAMQLGIVQSNNSTTLGVAQSGDAAQVAMTQANDAFQLGENANAAQLAAVQNTNATQLAAYGIQAQVANNQTAALESIATTVSNNAAQVQTTALNDATAIQTKQLTNQATVINDTYALTSSGAFNKGGEGGTNQVAAWNALINPASASSGDTASAAVGTAQATSTQIAGIIAALGGAAKNGLSQVFG